MKPKTTGGSVAILPIKNADHLTLFLRNSLDAAWTTEPWASRLIHEANGKELLDERTPWPVGKLTTTLILTTRAFLKAHPQTIKSLLDELNDMSQVIAVMIVITALGVITEKVFFSYAEAKLSRIWGFDRK